MSETLKPPFEFDRYVNGVLMAEGVTIERQHDLPSAAREAALIASRGPKGETPVLVLRAASMLAPAQAEAPVAVKVLQEALKPFAEASSRFDEAATHMGYAPSFDEYKPYTSFTHGDLRRARKAYEALASHPAPEPQAMGDAVLPRGGVEQDWWAESVKLYRRLRLIERAAQAVIDETAKIHDNEPWPVKYRAPYGAITELGKVLGDDTIEARKRSALDAASLASPLSSVPAPEPQAVPEGERAVAIRYRSTYDGHWQFWPIEEWNAEHGKGWRERYPNAEPLYTHPLPSASPKPEGGA